MATTDSEPAVSTTTEPDGEPEPTPESELIEESEPAPDLTRDEIFDVLSNRRRRYALHYLRRQGNGTTRNGTDAVDEGIALSDLAEQVAAWETGRTIKDLNAAERKRVYTSLQQFHLPRMDEQGVIDYDHRAGEVVLAEAIGDIDVYLDIVPRKDVPWSLYYLGLSAVSAILVGGASLGVYPFDLFDPVAYGAFLVTALLVSSIVHLYDTRRMKLGTNDAPPEIDRS